MTNDEINEELNQPFEFPERLLDQISESSPSGFLLFIVNEYGEIELFTKPTSDILETGLRTKALKILNTLNLVEDSELASQFLEDHMPPPPPQSEIKEDADDDGDPKEDWQE